MEPLIDFKMRPGTSSNILFLIVYRLHSEEVRPGAGNAVWRPIYKSEIKPESAAGAVIRYEFNQLSLLTSDLCSGDENRDVKIELFESEESGRHRKIDRIIFTVKQLTDLMEKDPINRQLELQKSGGVIKFKELRSEQRHSFLEYIFNGC